VYQLILVLASGVTTVGTYTDLTTCQSHLAQFHQQNVTAACVQQPTPEESLARAQKMMQSFIRMVETKSMFKD
jgi:hypothetical protein